MSHPNFSSKIHNGLCKVNDTSKILTSPLQKTSPGQTITWSLGGQCGQADRHKVTSHRYLSSLTPLARSRAVIHWPFSSCVQWKNMLLVTPAEHTYTRGRVVSKNHWRPLSESRFAFCDDLLSEFTNFSPLEKKSERSSAMPCHLSGGAT